MKQCRVLLADDHPILSEGLRKLLAPEYEVVGTAATGREALEQAAKHRPDVVVLDISMPEMNGIEAARRLRKDQPRVKIVFLSVHSDIAHVREAFRAGGNAYVLKRSAPNELNKAIGEALEGRTYLTPLVSKDVVEILVGRQSDEGSPAAELTLRQREVLQMLAEGRSVKETAYALNISSKTVEFHKYRIMEQIGVNTIAELVQYAIKKGVVSLDA